MIVLHMEDDMDYIFWKQQMVSALSNLLVDKAEELVDNTLQKEIINRRITKIENEIDTFVSSIDDTIIREYIQQFLSQKLLDMFECTDEALRKEILEEYQQQYGILWDHKTTAKLENFLDIMLKEVVQDFSLGDKMLFAECRKTNRLIQELNDKQDQILCAKQEKGNKMEEKVDSDICKYRGDYDNFITVWDSPLFLEEAEDAKKLSEVFVKTNYESIKFISRKKMKNSVYRNKGKEEHESDVNRTCSGINEYTPEAAITHYREDIQKINNVDNMIRSFLSSSDKICVILGQPGMGKSSFVSYLLGSYIGSSKKCYVVSLYKVQYIDGLFNSILVYLQVNREELENNILILDGLDELDTQQNGDSILINFINEVKNTYKDVNIFITMRENYVDIFRLDYREYYQNCNIICLRNFELLQMIDFHIKYTGQEMSIDRLRVFNDDKDVFGIPLILYMVYSLKIDITSVKDKYNLYRRIFSTEDGIYDKCNSGRGGYGIGQNRYSIEDKESFHNISQQIAFMMFEEGIQEIDKKYVDNEISKGEYTQLSIASYWYNNYYLLSSATIKFWHLSFYEYFLAEYICNTILNTFGNQMPVEERCHTLCEMFVLQKIDTEVFRHIECKWNGDALYLSDNFYDEFEECVNNIIMYGGITYIHLTNQRSALIDEAIIFANLMSIVTVLWRERQDKIKICDGYKRIMIKAELVNLEYFKMLKSLLICGIDIEPKEPDQFDKFPKEKGVLWGKVHIDECMQKYWINNQHLSGVYFTSAYLVNCRFVNVNLFKADFRSTHLQNVEFVGSDLRETDFTNSYLESVSFLGGIIDGAVFRGSIMKNVNFDEESIVILEKQNVDLSDVKVKCKDNGKNLYIEYSIYADLKIQNI